MADVPTEKQADLLRILAGGAMALAPGRRDWMPLLRRGWVAPEGDDDGSRFLPPLRITPDGLRAFAAAVERYGLPDIRGHGHGQVNEPPIVTRLKQELTDAKAQRDEARHDLSYERRTVERVRTLLAERSS